MVEALEAQMSKAGYNYGYTNDFDGEGAQQALVNAKGNFNSFNREQQAMIIQHYWVRRYSEQKEYAEWQPYADIVHSGPAAAAA
jgi:hypothetical protein